jgi:hypothetical protein
VERLSLWRCNESWGNVIVVRELVVTAGDWVGSTSWMELRDCPYVGWFGRNCGHVSKVRKVTICDVCRTRS